MNSACMRVAAGMVLLALVSTGMAASRVGSNGASLGSDPFDVASLHKLVAAAIERQVEVAGDEHEGNKQALTLLKQLDFHGSLLEDRLRQVKSLQAQIGEVEKQHEALEEGDADRTLTFLELEGLRDQLELEAERQDVLSADESLAKQIVEQLSREAAKSAFSQQAVERVLRQVGNAALGAEAAEALSAAVREIGRELRQAELAIAEQRARLSKARRDYLKARIDRVEDEVEFTARDRDARLAQWDEEEQKQQRLGIDAEARLQGAITEAPPAQPAAGQESMTLSHEVRLLRAETSIRQDRVAVIAKLRQAWKRRFALSQGGVSGPELGLWKQDAGELRDYLSGRAQSIAQRRQALMSTAATGVPDVAASSTAFSDLCKSLEEALAADERAIARYEDELADALRFATKPRDWWSRARESLDYEVVSAEDEGVTLRQLLWLVAFLVGSFGAAFAASRLLLPRVLAYVGLGRGAATAVRTIIFYALCTLLGLISFRLLEVPLTAFAFLGGAVAIGVGFGSQDIMNNFMSGLILLIEQPIRVGDVVEVDGARGRVRHIGLRSTKLDTEFNSEVLVPNSALIEQQVTNLTLTDELVKLSVTAGLDRELVVADAVPEMLRIAFRHPMTVKSPQPLALLKEADPYWLTFEIQFWVQYDSFDRCALIQSQILGEICDRFRPKSESETEGQTAPEPTDSLELPSAHAPVGHPLAAIAAARHVAAGS